MVDTAGPIVLQDTSRTHWRNRTYFTLALTYQPLSWFSATVGFRTPAQSHLPTTDAHRASSTDSQGVRVDDVPARLDLHGIVGSGDDGSPPKAAPPSGSVAA
jgi:hypothetical protein